MWQFLGLRLRLAESNIASFNPYRLGSAWLRALPNFLIIGTQRGGTTSLYNCLVQHPRIRGSSLKEVHYFDLNHRKGPLWYRSHFPLSFSLGGEVKILTGEASPYYLFHPLVPERVHQVLPQVKLIVMLRNPVERAISHYHYMVSLGAERLPLEEAIAREPLRLAGESVRIREDPHYKSTNHRRYGYLSRGLYYDQLRNWMGPFAREAFLILSSEEFFRDCRRVLKRVYEFLGLDDFAGVRYRRDNAGRHPEASKAVKQALQEYFEPANSTLFDYLGVDYDWKP